MLFEGENIIFNHHENEIIAQKIEEEDLEDNKNTEGKSSLSLQLNKYLKVSGVGDLLELINVFLSLVMTIIHSVDTYYYPEDVKTIIIIEISLYIYFIANFILTIYTSENKLLFCLSYNAIFEYISIFPYFFARIKIYPRSKYLFLSRIIRVIFVGRLEKVLARHSYEVARHLFNFLFSLIAIIMIASTFMWTLDNVDNLPYHDYLYFLVVSLTTVGFGDVHPNSIFGQIIIVATIAVLLGLIPEKFQKYNKAISLRSNYARASYKKTRKDVDHIILLGSNEIEGLKTFFSELYHTDHGVTDIKTILMQPQPPQEEIKINILKNPTLPNKVTYLEGTVMSQRDLKRAQAENCKCVIILANKFSTDPHSEDYKNILEAFAIKNYVRKVCNRNIRVCFQVMKPENKELYNESLSGDVHDQLICVEELKVFLLAKTCICPGITTMITLLITSNKPQYQSMEPPNESSNWIDEYVYGMQNEVYRVPFEPSKYVGLSFSLVSQQLYRQFNIILFGLEIQVDGEIKVFLNPASYIFQNYKHYGYVVAAKLPDIEALDNFSFPNIVRNFNINSMVEDNKIDEDQNKHNVYKSFYFTKTISLDSVTLNNTEDSKLENHIIVCGLVANMRQLLLPLRAKSLKNINSILILYNDQFPTSIWKQINRFPKVYYMQGSPMKLSDLEKACLAKAQAVVILSKHNENERHTTMADADTIFIYKTIKSANPNIRIITELANYSTISVLSSSRNNSGQKYDKFGQYTLSEPFAAGEIYMSFMLDTLICQAFYNPYITYIIEQLIMGHANLTEKERKKNYSLKIEQSNLFLVGVPNIFFDKTFGDLYDSLTINYKMIPLGLYRGDSKLGNQRPYTYVMPPPNTKIHAKDKVFVLSVRQPNETFLNEEVELQPNPQGRRDNPILKNQANIKSKLVGEEGRIDTETAQELFRLNNGLNEICGSLNDLNQKFFSHGLTKPELVNNVRKILKNKLNDISVLH